MEEKVFSVKTRNKIYNICCWAGVAVALIGYFMTGIPKQVLPWVGMAMVALGVIYRVTMVRCPYCGNHLAESKTIPDKCPECHKELN